MIGNDQGTITGRGVFRSRIFGILASVGIMLYTVFIRGTHSNMNALVISVGVGLFFGLVMYLIIRWFGWDKDD